MTPLDYLKEMKMPGLSIFFMTVSTAIAVLMPVALYIYFKLKYKSKIKSVLVGASIFIVFALVLESLFINVLPLDSLMGIYPTPAINQAIYIAIICLCSGLFEETGRFLAFKFVLQNDGDEVGTPLAYGVGHGGIEAVVLVGISMGSMIATSVMINNGQIINSLEKATNDQILGIIDLIQTDSHVFLAAGVERITAVALHISLSVLVWMAVRNKKLWLYPLAVVLHAVTNISAALYQLGIIENVWIIEGMVAVCVVAVIALTRWLYLKFEKSLRNVRTYADEEAAEETVEE